jgi:hypothetical protein
LGKRSRAKMTGSSLRQRIINAEEKRRQKKKLEAKAVAAVLKEMLKPAVPAILLKSENTPDDVTFVR